MLAECPLTIVENGKAREGHLTDLVAPSFTALHFSDGGELPAALENLKRDLDERGIPIRLVPITARVVSNRPGVHGGDHTGRLFGMYGAKPGSLYLVRPDGHVAGRWLEADAAEAKAAIERILGLRAAAQAINTEHDNERT